MPVDLEARVKELEAKVLELPIARRFATYAIAITNMSTKVSSLRSPAFSPKMANLDFAHLGKANGRKELLGFFGALNTPTTEAEGNRPRITWVKQFIHNHTIHLHGDKGHGFAYLEAKPIFNGEAFLVAARYDDEYIKRNGEWKFTKMSLMPYFMVPLKEGWAQEDRIKMRTH